MTDSLLADLLESWERAMRGWNRSPNTVTLYVGGVQTFLRWCADTDTTPELSTATVGQFLADYLAAGASANTAAARHKALRQFSKWLASEGEIPADALATLKQPQLTDKVVEALTDDQLRALIKACQGSRFIDHRDEAIVRLTAETGLRASELLALDVADVDLNTGLAIVRKGKGGKYRTVAFGPQTTAAIDRYLRARKRHVGVYATVTALWLSHRGTSMEYFGLRGALQKRAKAAGINNFHLHVLRNTYATRWLRAGGSEQGLMKMAGWRTRAMVDRYTGASAAERAAAEAHDLNLGDL